MKKVLLLAVGAAGALLAVRKKKNAEHEQALWAEVTDRVAKKN